jgi:hypothetical protein
MARPLGGVKMPAGIDLASVMVVFGSDRLANPSQFAARETEELQNPKTSNQQSLMASLLFPTIVVKAV